MLMSLKTVRKKEIIVKHQTDSNTSQISMGTIITVSRKQNRSATTKTSRCSDTNIKTLESDGLVDRKTDEADRRRTLVSVTLAGKALIARHRERNAQIFSTVESEFGREKLDLLLDLLDELQQIRM